MRPNGLFEHRTGRVQCYDGNRPGDSFMTKGKLTRQKMVAAAAPIFNQRGYEGSSLSALMEATGLKKGGIYRHFSSKEELAAEAFDYTWEAARSARTARGKKILRSKPSRFLCATT